MKNSWGNRKTTKCPQSLIHCDRPLCWLSQWSRVGVTKPSLYRELLDHCCIVKLMKLVCSSVLVHLELTPAWDRGESVSAKVIHWQTGALDLSIIRSRTLYQFFLSQQHVPCSLTGASDKIPHPQEHSPGKMKRVHSLRFQMWTISGLYSSGPSPLMTTARPSVQSSAFNWDLGNSDHEFV